MKLIATACASAWTAAAYTAGVVQHQVVYGKTDAETLSLNLGKYKNATAHAAAQGADIVVLPEFGLGMPVAECFDTSRQSVFCEPIPFNTGDIPCSGSSTSSPSIQKTASCLAVNSHVYLSINTCEAVEGVGNYNTQIVYDSTGAMIAKYRKVHPWYTSCFLKPESADLVTFKTSFSSKPFGVFICYDILFREPGRKLVDLGVTQFVYSAAIPLVGAAAQRLWSFMQSSTLLGSNLQDGQSGVFVNGSRVSVSPASGQDQVVVATVSEGRDVEYEL